MLYIQFSEKVLSSILSATKFLSFGNFDQWKVAFRFVFGTATEEGTEKGIQ